ncbi:MAG: hypothetical protein HWN65_21665 [Candidatus Helarchaeota archaeon]|nr:hypothetical protein [Candidatus Helarchaeota archaeon]
MAGKTVSVVGLAFGCGSLVLAAYVKIRDTIDPNYWTYNLGGMIILGIIGGVIIGVAIAGSVCSVVGAVKGSNLGIAGFILNLVSLFFIIYTLFS